MTTWPKRLLTQNSELRPDGVWNWTLPAFGVTLSNGKTMNVCPSAGACATFCYARSGTYRFSNVKARHLVNLEYILEAPDGWKEQMLREVQRPKMVGRYVRIHDSGDFFSYKYLKLWIDIAKQTPEVTFYAYTKEVSLFKKHAVEFPPNFLYLFSMGGKEDHLVDLENDRHADVFRNRTAIVEAGYSDQSRSDLLAITLESNKIGIPANNIRHYNKKMAGRTFAELQSERDEQLREKRANRSPFS
jgi:hypothetical protein